MAGKSSKLVGASSIFGGSAAVSRTDNVDAIQKGEPPAVMSRMVQVSVAADNKPMPPASALVEAQPAPAEVTVDQLNAPLRP